MRRGWPPTAGVVGTLPRMVFADSVDAVEAEVMAELLETVDKGRAASGLSLSIGGRLPSWLVRMRCCSNIFALTASRSLARVSSSGLGPGDLPLAVPSPGVVPSARVRPGSSASSWLREGGARRSPAGVVTVRKVSGPSSCSWARLDTRASGERRSWGRAVEGEGGVVVCSPDSVRARRLAGVESVGLVSSLLLGVRRGRVGFMALRPAGVVRAGLSQA